MNVSFDIVQPLWSPYPPQVIWNTKMRMEMEMDVDVEAVETSAWAGIGFAGRL